MEHKLVTEPIYVQLREMLVQLVRTKHRPGDRFLTERQLATRFDISRTTANKVLGLLVLDGVLEFRKGVGTFVRTAALNVDLKRLVSFTEKARAAGLDPHTLVRRMKTRPVGELKRLPAAVVAQALQLEPFTPVFELERVRSIGERIVVYERRAMAVAACPYLTEADAAGSLYTAFVQHFGIQVGDVSQRIRARPATEREARILAIPPASAVLELTALGRYADGRPLWYEETLYRGDAYEFVNHLRANSEGPQSVADHSLVITAEDATRAWYTL